MGCACAACKPSQLRLHADGAALLVGVPVLWLSRATITMACCMYVSICLCYDFCIFWCILLGCSCFYILHESYGHVGDIFSLWGRPRWRLSCFESNDADLVLRFTGAPWQWRPYRQDAMCISERAPADSHSTFPSCFSSPLYCCTWALTAEFTVGLLCRSNRVAPRSVTTNRGYFGHLFMATSS